MFYRIFSVLDKAKYHYQPLCFSRKTASWPWPLTLKQVERPQRCDVKTQCFPVWAWPTTFTYNPNLANVKVNSHAKYQGCRSEQFSRESLDKKTHKQRDRRMDNGCCQTHYFPASWSINIGSPRDLGEENFEEEAFVAICCRSCDRMNTLYCCAPEGWVIQQHGTFRHGGYILSENTRAGWAWHATIY